MDEKKITSLAAEALEAYKRIKADTIKLKDLKEKIIENSHGKNSSYKIELGEATVKVTKSKTDIILKFNNDKLDELDEETKSKFVKNKVFIENYSLNNENFIKLDVDIAEKLIKDKIINTTHEIDPKYNEFLKKGEKNLIPEDLNDFINEKKKQPFSVSFWLKKNGTNN